ncbi:MAG: hypothetical protein EAZ75_07055 [Flavobacteriia bacterium]|nr:MAG: hypothetical protein EAZ75_07055 [Flavobacteriia bacterium]
MSLGKKNLIVFGVLVVIGIISNAGKDKKGKEENNSTSSTEQSTEAPIGVKIGEVLKAYYFDITVNKAELLDRISTRNEFSDLKPENGNLYLIINATFKNTDSESRMFLNGSVLINY